MRYKNSVSHYASIISSLQKNVHRLPFLHHKYHHIHMLWSLPWHSFFMNSVSQYQYSTMVNGIISHFSVSAEWTENSIVYVKIKDWQSDWFLVCVRVCLVLLHLMVMSCVDVKVETNGLLLPTSSDYRIVDGSIFNHKIVFGMISRWSFISFSFRALSHSFCPIWVLLVLHWVDSLNPLIALHLSPVWSSG
jgi:hypothetical protein